MAYSRSSYLGGQPDKDTGWGLINRLNNILYKIEYAVDSGDYEKWNRLLDRVFINITYKNSAEIVYDGDGKMIDIQLPKADIEVFSKINERVKIIKNEIQRLMDEERKSKGKIHHDIRVSHLKTKLYNIYVKKDIWVRKKMFQVGLYLKASDSDPSKAIYSS